MKIPMSLPRASNGIQNQIQAESDKFLTQNGKIHLSLKKNISEVELDKYQDKMFTR